MTEMAEGAISGQGHTIRYEDTQDPSTKAIGLSIQQVDALRARQQAEVQQHNPAVETVAPTLGGEQPSDEEVVRDFYTSVLDPQNGEKDTITLPDGQVISLPEDDQLRQQVLEEAGIDPLSIPDDDWKGPTYNGFKWPPQLKRTDPDFEVKRLTYQTDQELASDEPFPWAKNGKKNGQQGGLAGLLALAREKIGFGPKPQNVPPQPDAGMNTVRNTGE